MNRMLGAPFTHPSILDGCGRGRRAAPGRNGMIPPVSVSTITKHRHHVSVRLGDEIRRRRWARGMTQTQLGRPLTRGFVSAIEHGRCLPSLAVLALFANWLNVSPAELLDSVKYDLASMYTAADGEGSDALAHS